MLGIKIHCPTLRRSTYTRVKVDTPMCISDVHHQLCLVLRASRHCFDTTSSIEVMADSEKQKEALKGNMFASLRSWGGMFTSR